MPRNLQIIFSSIVQNILHNCCCQLLVNLTLPEEHCFLSELIFVINWYLVMSSGEVLSQILKEYSSIKDVVFSGVFLEDFCHPQHYTNRKVVLVTGHTVQSTLKKICDLDHRDKIWKGVTCTTYPSCVKLYARSITGDCRVGQSGYFKITKYVGTINFDFGRLGKTYDATIDVDVEFINSD